MKAGAHDYLMKGNLNRLAPAVERELRDAVPGLIYSGTSDIQRNTIARLLGARADADPVALAEAGQRARCPDPGAGIVGSERAAEYSVGGLRVAGGAISAILQVVSMVRP